MIMCSNLLDYYREVYAFISTNVALTILEIFLLCVPMANGDIFRQCKNHLVLGGIIFSERI